MTPAKLVILIVDDEKEITALLREIILEINPEYDVIVANNYHNAKRLISEKRIDIALLDIWLENQSDGIELLKLLKIENPDSQAIMISGHGNISAALQSVKIGALDYIEKPIRSARLKIAVNNALNVLKLKNFVSKNEETENQFLEIVGKSKFSNELRSLSSELSSDNRRVFITGEQGTGKNFLAKYIHKLSKQKKFLTITRDLYDSHRSEFLENGFNGTIYLKEVTDFPKNYQIELLQLINSSNQNNTRIISSTNKNIEYATNAGFFDSELYLRLNTVKINMQNLNNRIEDIPDFCDFFVNYFVKINNSRAKHFSESAIYRLQNYQWHENIAQLKNVIEWILSAYSHKDSAEIIEPDMLSPTILHKNIFNVERILPMLLKDARDEFEKYYLIFHLKRNNSSITKTAEAVGLDRSSLHRKLKGLGIECENLYQISESNQI